VITDVLYIQPVYDSFTVLADRSAKVPKLRSGKRYEDYNLHDREWAILTTINKALAVSTIIFQ
jgi:hypothetical protein